MTPKPDITKSNISRHYKKITNQYSSTTEMEKYSIRYIKEYMPHEQVVCDPKMQSSFSIHISV